MRRGVHHRYPVWYGAPWASAPLRLVRTPGLDHPLLLGERGKATEATLARRLPEEDMVYTWVPHKRKNKKQKKQEKRQKAHDVTYESFSARTLDTMEHLHNSALARALRRGEDAPDRPAALVHQGQVEASPQDPCWPQPEQQDNHRFWLCHTPHYD